VIGLALITFVAILGAGLRTSFGDAVDKLFVADYALTASNGFDPFTKEADAAVARHTGRDGCLALPRRDRHGQARHRHDQQSEDGLRSTEQEARRRNARDALQPMRDRGRQAAQRPAHKPLATPQQTRRSCCGARS
jgi:hypothetical protein